MALPDHQEVTRWLCLLCLGAALAGCRTYERVDLVVVRQPKVNAAEVDMLAVVGFGETGQKGIDDFLAAECEKRLQDHYPRKLVSRKRTRELLQERNLWKAVFTDQPAQRQAGELLKASHLLIGTVVKFQCKDTVTQVPVKSVTYFAGEMVVRERQGTQIERAAEVQLALRVVDADSGELLVSDAVTAIEPAKPSIDGKPLLPEPGVLLESATQVAFGQLVRELVPVRYRSTVTLAVKGRLEEGVDALRAGQVSRARLLFKEEIAGPDDAWAWYNLGMVHELLREFKLAREAFDRALEIRPREKMFLMARNRVVGRGGS